MPTEGSHELLGWEGVEGRRVVAAFDGGRITSDAGTLLPGAANRAIGPVRRLAGCFADGRARELVEPTVETMLMQRICGIALEHHGPARPPPVGVGGTGDLMAPSRCAIPGRKARLSGSSCGSAAGSARLVRRLVAEGIRTPASEPRGDTRSDRRSGQLPRDRCHRPTAAFPVGLPRSTCLYEPDDPGARAGPALVARLRRSGRPRSGPPAHPPHAASVNRSFTPAGEASDRWRRCRAPNPAAARIPTFACHGTMAREGQESARREGDFDGDRNVGRIGQADAPDGDPPESDLPESGLPVTWRRMGPPSAPVAGERPAEERPAEALPQPARTHLAAVHAQR
jgi:hypothetical protein